MKIPVAVPDGNSNEWAVSTFTISEEDADFQNLRALFHPGARFIEPGTYKRLTRNGRVIMSNTPEEIGDLTSFMWRAKTDGGHILINGLGLGVALAGILDSDKIEDITVIEKSEDVLNLVAPTFQNNKRISIIHADAFDWQPPRGQRYNVVWHDIWDDICRDNLPEMTRLHRKYGRRANWQGSWCKG